MTTLADVERIREAMKAMPDVKPEERTLNNQQAISELTAEITEMRQRGYTWEQVADFFTENGIAIKATTLKSYARRASVTPKARKPRQKKEQVAATKQPQAQAKEAPKVAPKEVQKSDKKASDSDATFTPREDNREI